MISSFVEGEFYKFAIPKSYIDRVGDVSGIKCHMIREGSDAWEIKKLNGDEIYVLKDEYVLKVIEVTPGGIRTVLYKYDLETGQKNIVNGADWHTPPISNPNWQNWFMTLEEWEEKNIKQKPKVSIHSVVIASDKREQIQAAISQPKYNDLIFTDWGFEEVFEKGTAVSLLFHGGPGTGKTLMAQAIADELGQDLKMLSTAEIESMEPGGAERNIKMFFKEAGDRYEKSMKNKGKAQILLFDECDSLLSDRNQIGVILAAQVNVLLTELERFKGVVIFTTNRLGKLDPALERRITAKIFFETPNKEQRLLIWQRMIPSKAPIDPDVSFEELAEFPIPGGNIKNAVLNAVRKAAYSKSSTIKRDHFIESVSQELDGLETFKAEHAKAPRQAAPIGGLSASRDMGIQIEKVKSRERRR